MARTRLVAMFAAAGLVLVACDGSSGAGDSRSASATARARVPPSTRATSGPASSSSTGATSTTTTDSHAALPNSPPDSAPAGATSTTTTTTVTASTTPSNAGDMDSGHGVLHYGVGQTGTLWDPWASVPVATVTVSAPTFSTSDGSGDSPQFGYYATFTVTMTDIAPPDSADDIVPDSDNFYVEEPDGRRYGNGPQPNVQAGNGYAAERPDDLGTDPTGRAVDLLPGQSSTGTVVVDVPSEHGQLVFQGSDDNLVDGSWAY